MVWLMVLVACSSYPASTDADAALVSGDGVEVVDDGYLSFLPAEPKGSLGVVFYPGGLVAPEAYAPPLRVLAENGVVTLLARMPSDLAVLAPGKATRMIEDHPDVDRWVIAGHSLGGAMAAGYAADHPDTIAGLALWAAYPAAKVDLSSAALAVLDLTASEDGVLNRDAWSEASEQLPASTRRLEIAGGNHAGFGAYGPQDGDGIATISPEDQQAETVAAMLELIAAIED